jgi:hypothetical protein
MMHVEANVHLMFSQDKIASHALRPEAGVKISVKADKK